MNVNEMVGRLRKGAGDECGGCCYLEDMLQAADMLVELRERIEFLEAVTGQSSMDLFRDNCLLRAQVEKLETKCALLAASWKKAEDELEKMRAAQPDVK
jgi:hypothetical protein